MIKLGWNIHDGHVTRGERSHAEQIRNAREYDDTVRAIVFPEKKAVYFRLFCPSWDGVSGLTEDQLDAAYSACHAALEVFVRCGHVRKSWKVLYWATGRILSDWDVRV